MISLVVIPILFQACVPVTYTAYNANRYRLGRTLGQGLVHVTTSLASAPVVSDAGETTRIESSVDASGTTMNFELTMGILDRTDVILNGGVGTGSGHWGFAIQQQLTPRGEPFALSVAPGMSFIDGQRDDSDDDEWDWGEYSSSLSSWIDSRMTVTELRVPMSYRFTKCVELLWGVGLLYFDHRADYGDSDGTSRHLERYWTTPVGSVGIRLGFVTLEATRLSFDGHPMNTVGSALRFHF
jgi:hypothetical protein